MITTHKINIGREPFRNLGGIETANRSHTGKRTRFRAKFPTPIFFKILHARSFRWESGLARSGSERFLPPYPWAGVVLMNRPIPVCSGNLNPLHTGTPPGTVQNVVRKSVTRQTKQAPMVWACSCALFLFGLSLFVGFLFLRGGLFPTVNRFPFRVGVLSERQEPRRLLPFKHYL